MATLLEQLQQRLSGQQAVPRVQAGPNIAEILQAKKGKAGPIAGIASTSPAAEMAADQANVELQQQQQAGQLQAQALGAKEEEIRQAGETAQQKLLSAEQQASTALAGQAARQRAESSAAEESQLQKIKADKELKLNSISQGYQSALQKMASDRGIMIDSLFADVAQENAVLSARRDASQLEQKAALLALSDRQYIDELNRIGEERKLNDEIEFDKATKELVFGQELNKKLNDINFQIKMDSRDRDTLDQISRLSNYEIIDLANSAARQAMMKAQFEAGSEIAKAGAAAYSKEGQ